MKKLSLMFLLLVAGLFFTACGDDSDVPANGYIETTEEGSATFILKGYEDASDGFNVIAAYILGFIEIPLLTQCSANSQIDTGTGLQMVIVKIFEWSV